MPETIPVEELALVEVLNIIVQEKRIELGLSMLEKVRDSFSLYNEYMEKILDLIIKKGDLELALNVLRETQIYFSSHEKYLEKVGGLIK